MKIGLAIPFYNNGNNLRAEITKKLFNHYNKIKESLLDYNIDLKICFIGSEGEISESFCKEFLNNNIYVDFNQDYKDFKLRDKYNKGLQSLGEKDYYCICGSNDLVFIDSFLSLNNNLNIDLIGVKADYEENNLIVLDYEKKIGFKSSGIYPPIKIFEVARYNRIIGGFLAISKKLFLRLDKKPFFNDWDEVGLESDCVMKHIPRGFISSKIINIKTDYDITHYDIIKQHHYNGELSESELSFYLKYLREL